MSRLLPLLPVFGLLAFTGCDRASTDDPSVQALIDVQQQLIEQLQGLDKTYLWAVVLGVLGMLGVCLVFFFFYTRLPVDDAEVLKALVDEKLAHPRRELPRNFRQPKQLRRHPQLNATNDTKSKGGGS